MLLFTQPMPLSYSCYTVTLEYSTHVETLSLPLLTLAISYRTIHTVYTSGEKTLTTVESEIKSKYNKERGHNAILLVSQTAHLLHGEQTHVR